MITGEFCKVTRNCKLQYQQSLIKVSEPNVLVFLRMSISNIATFETSINITGNMPNKNLIFKSNLCSISGKISQRQSKMK